jgi:hypothetical protein
MVFSGIEDDESGGMWKEDVLFSIPCTFEEGLQKISFKESEKNRPRLKERYSPEGAEENPRLTSSGPGFDSETF